MNVRLTAEQIFHKARDLPAEKQEGYINGACLEDVSLRATVAALLRADADAGSFLKVATGRRDAAEHHDDGSDQDATIPKSGRAAHTRAPIAPAESPGEMIGRYKLLQPIGEGGFGSVWMAEQREPVKRRVALKIIKLGMDTKQVIARFEAERQALAMMDHPNIAKVLDAGSTEKGRPYFVMEYIKGVPILEYCDTDKLDTKARLDLFTSVCHAIQHAHQKGIIHRDIKPSNVLVTMHDGVPVPKVIDFGIAKATSAELTTKTLFTEHRQMIGTPAYMSPEQAEMSGLDIDTRSDIYSLGVLLYELLTGTTPFDSKELLSKGFAEMMRIIREVEPHKPSTRLSSLGDTGTRTAQQRHAGDIKKLGLILRGDLDWIVMKCLEKDRTRRYETANGLAADIKRHLNDEAVTAGAPSAGYKLRKFVKRHRGQVIAGSIVAAALVLGAVGTTSGMVWALNEKSRADGEAAKATASAVSEAAAKVQAQENEQRAIAEAQRAEAAKEEEADARKRAETITEFVTTALMASDAQNVGGGQDMTILAAMDNAIADIDSGRFKENPEIEAELRNTIAVILLNNGRYTEAEPLFRRVLEIRERMTENDDMPIASSLNNLAAIFLAQGRFSQAQPLYERSLAIYQKVQGPDHPDVAESLNNLASLYESQGKYEEAEPLYKHALAIAEKTLGPKHRTVAVLLNNLAMLYGKQGQHAQADSRYSQALSIYEIALGSNHPSVASCLNNLAVSYYNQGRYGEAEPLYKRALLIREKSLSPDHPDVLITKSGLAAIYWSTGNLEKSIPLFEAILVAQDAKLGRQHPNTLATVANLGVNYKDAGRLAEALPLLEEAFRASKKYQQLSFVAEPLLDAFTKTADPSKPSNTANVLVLIHEMLGNARDAMPKDSPELAGQLAQFGLNLLGLKAWGEAEPLIRESLAIREIAMPDDWRTFNTKSLLGGALLGQKKLAEAEPLLLEGYSGMKAREAVIPLQGRVRIPESLERLVRLYEALGNETEAAAWRSKL